MAAQRRIDGVLDSVRRPRRVGAPAKLLNLPQNSRKAWMKETLVGLGNGLATGAVAMLALIVNLLVAAMAGTLIPLGLRAIRIDPALASTAIITTFTGACGFAAFLGLAALFLRCAPKAG